MLTQGNRCGCQPADTEGVSLPTPRMRKQGPGRGHPLPALGACALVQPAAKRTRTRQSSGWSAHLRSPTVRDTNPGKRCLESRWELPDNNRALSALEADDASLPSQDDHRLRLIRRGVEIGGPLRANQYDSVLGRLVSLGRVQGSGDSFSSSASSFAALGSARPFGHRPSSMSSGSGVWASTMSLAVASDTGSSRSPGYPGSSPAKISSISARVNSMTNLLPTSLKTRELPPRLVFQRAIHGGWVGSSWRSRCSSACARFRWATNTCWRPAERSSLRLTAS